MNSGTWKLTIDGPVAVMQMNRPEVLNAANPQWMTDLHSLLDEVEAAEALRVVIICGAGRAFSTGIDLKALARGEIQLDWFRSWEQALRRIERLEPITIAKIHGYAIGGGLQVALACDLRIAAASAQMGLPAVLEALIPGLGTYRLPRFVGLGRARRMILTGELVGAEEALRIGLVDWVAAEAELDQMTAQVAEQMMRGAKAARHLSKRLATISFETELELFCETYLAYQARALASPEHTAAMEAYLKTKGYAR
jgi:enoyl-CoA hydratase/carnithine racemase